MKKKPTDHEILTALNKIIRESQKPKKVELGLIDEANKAWKRGNDKNSEAGKIAGKLTKIYAEAEKEFEQSVELYEKSLKVAKELGIEVGDISKKLQRSEASKKQANKNKKITSIP